MISNCCELEIPTQGYTDILDITSEVQATISQTGLHEGLVTVFVPGSTASLSTIEYEQGALSDLKEALDRIAPKDKPYKHNMRWGDGNGFSHVRSSLLGPSLTVPVKNGALVLGTWQQIILMDHDNRPRNRRVIVQLIGVGS